MRAERQCTCGGRDQSAKKFGQPIKARKGEEKDSSRKRPGSVDTFTLDKPDFGLLISKMIRK